MRIKGIKEIKGTIKLLSGTRVGGNSEIIEIGGNDNPVIRNPLTGELYIPGSSIKGKMRVLTEWLEGKISKDGSVHSCSDSECGVCRTFGRGAKDSSEAKSGPTRISVKDAYLTEESKVQLEKLKNRTGLDTEWKYENSINRLTSAANPRNLERIPAGVEFEFAISYKVLDMGDSGKIDEKNLEEVLMKGLKGLLLEGIGGGSSRGNGQIEFSEITMNGESIKEKIESITI